MSLFGTTTADNFDGLSIPSLLPGKYENVRLVDVKSEKATKGTGEEGKRIINFIFKTADGQTHQHTEWEVLATDKDAEKKAKNMTKRIGHIMSKFVPKEQLAQNNADFAGYATWVVSTIKAVPFQDVAVDILIVGNVFNNKATAGFSGYPPFICKSGDVLDFDNNGKAANKAYEVFQAKQNGGTGSQPDGTEGGSSAPSYAAAGQTATNDF